MTTLTTLRIAVEPKDRLPSPKQLPSDSVGRSSLYPYYAGFSVRFAATCIKRYIASSDATVLDPWNGGGTTTQAASDLGLRCFGVDINPVPLVVARSRLIHEIDIQSINDFIKFISNRNFSTVLCDTKDHLLNWFKPSGASALRAIEKHITASFEVNAANPLISQAAPCFCFVALCRVMRELMKPQRSQNPTWTKRPKDLKDRIGCNRKDVQQRFVDVATELINEVMRDKLPNIAPAQRCHLAIGNAQSLPLPNSSVDLILTSPPYCTRIDYAISFSSELALLGIGEGSGMRRLRDDMTGTSTIRKANLTIDSRWGQTCSDFLNKVSGHKSKASKSYYLKSHLQYFSDLFNSIGECRRVSRHDGMAIMVIQDSFYKDIHNDVPRMAIEMMQFHGFELIEQENFPVTKNMVKVNKAAAKYKVDRQNVESVLVARNP